MNNLNKKNMPAAKVKYSINRAYEIKNDSECNRITISSDYNLQKIDIKEYLELSSKDETCSYISLDIDAARKVHAALGKAIDDVDMNIDV